MYNPVSRKYHLVATRQTHLKSQRDELIHELELVSNGRVWVEARNNDGGGVRIRYPFWGCHFSVGRARPGKT